MKKDAKAKIIDEIAGQIAEAEAIYAVDYRGLSVSQAARLRASLREADSSFRIVKNTLTLRAADQSAGDGAEHVKELLEGPTALAFVQGDPALAAKALDAFARAERVLEFRGGILSGRPMSSDAVRALARLPARDQLNAQLAGVVASPLTGLVRGLGSLLSGLAVALAAVRDIKQAEAPGEAAEGESAPDQQAETAADGAGAPTTEAGGESPDDADQQSEASEAESEEKNEKENGKEAG